MSNEMRNALFSEEFRHDKSLRSAMCLAAADMAGSRLSKVFALLHMLSQDLDYKVSLADEAYNMYKMIKLPAEDETILVLCSYYLTLKLNEVWKEIETQSPGFVPRDQKILDEFLRIAVLNMVLNRMFHTNYTTTALNDPVLFLKPIGWAKEIKSQQEVVIENDRKREQEDESTLYAFLGRVRLNIALDALREVRCVARATDRVRITHVLLQDAVRAHHRRSVFAKKIAAPVIRTYGPTLDDRNITGQNVKVFSILPKTMPKPRDILSSNSSAVSS